MNAGTEDGDVLFSCITYLHTVLYTGACGHRWDEVTHH